MSDLPSYEDIPNGHIYREYGIPVDEAEVHAQIDAVYQTRFRRLQEQHGKYGVPLMESLRIGDEARRAHGALARQRHEEQKRDDVKAKREAGRAAASAQPSGAPAQRPTSPAGRPSEPQRPAGGALVGSAGDGTSRPDQRATLAPVQPNAGTVADVETALAAFTRQPDKGEQ